MIAKETFNAGEKLPANDYNQNAKNANDAGGFRDNLIAGEAINGSVTPVSVFISSADKELSADAVRITQDVGTWQNQIYSGVYLGQTFTPDASFNLITKITIYGLTYGTSGAIRMFVYGVDGNGKPTGTALGTASVNIPSIPFGTLTYVDFTFATPIQIIANTKYCIVLTNQDNNQSNRFHWCSNNSNTYAGGERLDTSTGQYNSGLATSWTINSADDLRFKVSGKLVLQQGKVYKSQANDANRAFFSGFLTNNAVMLGSASVIQNGIIRGLSGLSAGLKYYVQNAIGTIGTALGSAEVSVGIAISATELLVRFGTDEFIGSAGGSFNMWSGLATNLVLNVPANCRKILIYGSGYFTNNSNNWYSYGMITLTKQLTSVASGGRLARGYESLTYFVGSWDTALNRLTLSTSPETWTNAGSFYSASVYYYT